MKQFDIDELTLGCSSSNGRESARKIIVRIGSDVVEVKRMIRDTCSTTRRNNVRSNEAKNKKIICKNKFMWKMER
jgi:hypothetical protein